MYIMLTLFPCYFKVMHMSKYWYIKLVQDIKRLRTAKPFLWLALCLLIIW